MLFDFMLENTSLPNELVFIIAQYGQNFPIAFQSFDRKVYAFFPYLAASQNETITFMMLTCSAMKDDYSFYWYNQESGLILFYSILHESFQTYQILMDPKLTIKQIDTPNDVKTMLIQTKTKIIVFPGITQFPNDKVQQILECLNWGCHIVCKLSDSDILVVDVDNEKEITYYFYYLNNVLKFQKLNWNYPTHIPQVYDMHYFNSKLLLIIENKIFTTTLNLPIKANFQPVWHRCTCV